MKKEQLLEACSDLLIEEIERLETINAELLDACKSALPICEAYSYDVRDQLKAAIEKAKQ